MTNSRKIRLAFAALAVAFFATPVALRAVGIRAQAFENRRFAAAPRLADGWSFFNEATRFLIDRMPLRYQAVQANTWIDRHVYNTTPVYGLNGLGGVAADQALPFTGNTAQDKAALTAGAAAGRKTKRQTQPPATAAQVAIGKDGWLFLQGVFDRACSPFISFSDAAARWEELLRVIRATGRRAVLLVPPDKQTIYPEYVAPGTANLACARTGTADLWQVIESPTAVAAGIIGLRKPLLAEKRSTRAPLYYRTDSHWNSVGSLAFVESALSAFSTRVTVLPSEIVKMPWGRFSGDLLGLLGEPGSEMAPSWSVRRAPGAPTVAGSTVIVGDSYVDSPLPELRPYFSSPIDFLQWVENRPQEIADGIASARNVILDTVEREFDYRATGSAFITPSLIALVRATLARHRLRAR